MSMRPMIYPVDSIETIRAAIGSRDESLVDRMVVAYREIHEVKPGPSDEAREACEAVRASGRSFVEGSMPGGKEPGEWSEAVYLAACVLGPVPGGLPINEDWKWIAWDEYFDLVADRLPDDARTLLRWLVHGRPLKGEPAEVFGTYYAWLASGEVERLLAALNLLETSDPDASEPGEDFLGELEDFHEELRGWLEACRGKDLLLVGS